MSDLSVCRPNLFAPGERPSPVVDDIRLTGWRALVKDCGDRIAAVVALILLGPVLAYFAVLVRCSGQGPVLVRQVRVGRNGRTFTLLKFRTVIWSERSDVDPEDELSPVLESTDDGVLPIVSEHVRVTRLGRLMRLSGFDELPQLLNILRGQMSFVGPRPRLPSQAAELPYQVLPLLLAKPGLVGLSQMAGVTTGAGRDALDLYYVRSWSFGLDLAIAVRAGRQLLSGPRGLADPFVTG